MTRLSQTDISDETLAVSKWNFVLMGLLDCLALVLVMVPAGRVPAPLTVVLVQVRTGGWYRACGPCSHAHALRTGADADELCGRRHLS